MARLAAKDGRSSGGVARGWLTHAFFWYWLMPYRRSRRLHNHRKGFVASSRTDLTACNDGAVMDVDRRQPIRGRSGPERIHSARRLVGVRAAKPRSSRRGNSEPDALVISLARILQGDGGQGEEGGGGEPKHEIAVVVLTQADRPAELARAIASVRAQQQVDLQLVLVVNGAHSARTRAFGSARRVAREVGIPGGRNIGATAADARLICSSTTTRSSSTQGGWLRSSTG